MGGSTGPEVAGARLPAWASPMQILPGPRFRTLISLASPVRAAYAECRPGLTVIVFSDDPNVTSILEFAEANGVKIDAGCRAGNCGTCLVAIKSGSVDYVSPSGASAEHGSCLTCICKPKTDLVLDA